MSYGQMALNAAHGGLRMMTDFAAPAGCALLLLELARRAGNTVLRHLNLIDKRENLNDNGSIMSGVWTALFPFRNHPWSNPKVLKICLATLAFGVIGSTVLRKSIGDVPPMCNRLLSVLGPVRISDKPWAVLRWFSR